MTQKAPVGIRMCLLMQCLEECLNVLQVGPVLCQGYVSEKNALHKLDTKYLFKTLYFLGVRGLIASSYKMYNYTTSGLTDV